MKPRGEHIPIPKVNMPIGPAWFGTSVDGFRKGKPVLRIREWEGFKFDLDVPLPWTPKR